MRLRTAMAIAVIASVGLIAAAPASAQAGELDPRRQALQADRGARRGAGRHGHVSGRAARSDRQQRRRASARSTSSSRAATAPATWAPPATASSASSPIGGDVGEESWAPGTGPVATRRRRQPDRRVRLRDPSGPEGLRADPARLRASTPTRRCATSAARPGPTPTTRVPTGRAQPLRQRRSGSERAPGAQRARARHARSRSRLRPGRGGARRLRQRRSSAPTAAPWA